MKRPYVPSGLAKGLFVGIAISVGYVVYVVWQTSTAVQNEALEAPKPVVAIDSTPGTSNRTKLPNSDYIGSASCSDCHPQIAETYRSHSSMSKSLSEAATAPALEDYLDRNSFSPDGRHTYSVEKTPEGIFHHERLTDEDGETLYDQAVRVDYAMGSGHRGRSYLIDRGGLLFMSPITWYSNAERWDLSPQYKLPHHRRFERRITDECLDCHSGKINSVRGSNIRFGTPPILEVGIGCEKCHGPGGEHARLRREGLLEDQIDPIVNPSKIDSAAREDLCAQCHLSGEGRYARIGYEIGDFRPGQRLEETCVIFVEGTRTKEGTTRAVSQVEQMRASRCFKSSAGRFGCNSCHEAHSSPQPSEIDSFYRQKCLTCHEEQGCSIPESERLGRQSNDSCIACHMPSLKANDVPHTAQTDHRILRQPTTEEPPSGPSGLPEFYDDAEKRLPRLAIDFARALWLTEHASKRSDQKMAEEAFVLLSEVENEIPNDVRLLDALGTVSAVRGRLDDSLVYWKRALAIDPEREKTIESVAIVLHSSNRLKEARPYIEQFLKLNPWKSSLWGRYAWLLVQQNEWDQAIIAAKKAEELDPSVPQTYRFLADALQQVGNAEQSRLYRDKFERIQRLRK